MSQNQQLGSYADSEATTWDIALRNGNNLTFGKRLQNYPKSPYFESINQLFLWPFSIAICGNQTWRAGKYTIQFGDFPIEPKFRVDFQPATFDFRRVILVVFVWVKTEDLGCFYVLVPLFDPYPRSSKRRKQTDVPSGSQTWQWKIPFAKGL